MKTKLLIAICILATVPGFATPPSEEGKSIFTTRCAGCHNVNKVLAGPALAGVMNRRSIDWIINFIHSSQTVIKSGDTSALALFEKFNKIQMPDHPDLKTEDIKNILAYIKEETSVTAVDVKPFAIPGKLQPTYTPLSFESDASFFYTLFGLVAALVFSLLALVKVKKSQREKLSAQI